MQVSDIAYSLSQELGAIEKQWQSQMKIIQDRKSYLIHQIDLCKKLDQILSRHIMTYLHMNVSANTKESVAEAMNALRISISEDPSLCEIFTQAVELLNMETGGDIFDTYATGR